jgi:hypothetical protein
MPSLIRHRDELPGFGGSSRTRPRICLRRCARSLSIDVPRAGKKLQTPYSVDGRDIAAVYIENSPLNYGPFDSRANRHRAANLEGTRARSSSSARGQGKARRGGGEEEEMPGSSARSLQQALSFIILENARESFTGSLNLASLVTIQG